MSKKRHVSNGGNFRLDALKGLAKATICYEATKITAIPNARKFHVLCWPSKDATEDLARVSRAVSAAGCALLFFSTDPFADKKMLCVMVSPQGLACRVSRMPWTWDWVC